LAFALRDVCAKALAAKTQVIRVKQTKEDRRSPMRCVICEPVSLDLQLQRIS